MKNLILMIVATMLFASCATKREFVQGTEHGQYYKEVKKSAPYQLESVQILQDTFYVTSESKFLLKKIARTRTDVLTGNVTAVWSKYPFLLIQIPNLTYVELENQKAITTKAKEVRDKIFIQTEKNLSLPLQILHTLGQDWISFPIKSSKVFPSLRISGSEDIMLIAMVPITEGTFIDVQGGCKNVYIQAKGVYVLLPEFLKKDYYKTWKMGEKFSFEDFIPAEKETAIKTPSQKKEYKAPLSAKKNNPCIDGYYIVKPGDNLWKIAEILNMPYKKLLGLNPCIGDTIYPGQKIKIK